MAPLRWRPAPLGAATHPETRMATTFFHLTTVAILAVLAVLGVGLWNMGREGTASLSQKLMRWRVGLQFVAIVVIMLAVLFRRMAAG